MTVAEFFAVMHEHNRARPGYHVFNSPLTDAELAAWQRDHPGVDLPAEYLALLRQANGFTLDTKTCPFEFYPLHRVSRPSVALYEGSDVFDTRLPPAALTLGDGGDGNLCIILDPDTAQYFLSDPHWPIGDEPLPSIDALLEALAEPCLYPPDS